MKRITQPNNAAEATFDEESRGSYFNMLKQAQKNLSMVDTLPWSDSMKSLLNDSVCCYELSESDAELEEPALYK